MGLVLGAIPGLTATMAIALVIPLTYYLSPTQSLVMLLAAYFHVFTSFCLGHFQGQAEAEHDVDDDGQ